MNHPRILLLLFFVIPIISLLTANPAQAGTSAESKHEFRSIWLTTAWALDWPSGTNAASQKQQMLDILDQHVNQNMNAVVFQGSARGDAFYKSERLPWSYALTGNPGQDPGWDPLQFVIDEARKRGLEVHAWFNAYTVTYNSQNDSPESADIPNVRFTNPKWLSTTASGERWLNPGIPEGRDWHIENVMELVGNYDIDAIHFDRIRYPSGGFSEDDSLMAVNNPDDISGIANWRRHNVNEFMRLVHEGVQEIKPWVKVGVTPVGHYDSGSTDGWAALLGYNSVFQDSRYWAEAGYIDYIAPQIYWDIGSPPRFTYIANDWVQKRRNNRHLYIGIGASTGNIKNELGAQIDTTRSVGAEGQLYFRNFHVATSNFSGRYDNPAIVPPMTWRNMSVPNSIRNFDYVAEDSAVLLSWDEPEPRRGEENPFFRYVIYRTDRDNVLDHNSIIDNPARIVSITGEKTYTDNWPTDGSVNNRTYYVTALSRNNVEGDFEMVEISHTPTGVFAETADRFFLEQNYPNPFNPTTNIAFTLPEQSHVTLRIFDIAGRNVATLVNEYRNVGTHTVTWEASGLASGVYIYRIDANDFTQSRSMMLVK